MSENNSLEFDWCNYKWYAYEHCKNDTTNCKNAYLGTNVIKNNKDNSLQFPIEYEPKSFVGDILNTRRKYKCAFIESSHVFTYGTYVFKAMIGNSPNTWPAIWLYGAECWPPEIDILEAYPDKDGDISNFPYVRWETNIHYNEYNPQQYGAKGINSLIYKLTHKDGKPDTWKLVWTPKSIKIYFNGIRVRKVTDKEVINHFNKYNKMRVVVNNMLQEDFDNNDLKNQQKFILYDFQYIPYK